MRMLIGRRMRMGWLEGQVAIVTGAASGIGRAVAVRFVAEGARVVAVDRAERGLATLRAELGSACTSVAGDASLPDANARAVAAAITSFGRLDTVISNVGVFDWHKRLDRLSPEDCMAAHDEMFAINVRSHALMAREAYPHLKEVRGSLVMTCSTASFRGGGGGALYTASKFAVRGLVYQLAHEWAPDVRVNAVAPGGTVTGLSGIDSLGSAGRRLEDDDRIVAAVGAATPLGFAAAPEDHAGAYVLLASADNSRGMTGTVIVSDGGLLARI
ncbi:SDR family oxidoreductase [Sphingomonas sp. AR_OL41]|uniref:SDR family oxidoreductase n=1 Tax=Sphingomonas sp. AR_OL41 TaxID=3042729 RepID=UPI002480C755|nr:SDR family oxidoreductase [Sphingomonas sp. AR_OL41]MDH7972951.1 SDR family oxidoreductase [Sphingomonas sp. AR_OL41]